MSKENSTNLGTFRGNVDNDLRDFKDLVALIDDSDKFEVELVSPDRFKIRANGE